MTVKNCFKGVGSGKTMLPFENEVRISGFMMRFISIMMLGCFEKESRKYMENFRAFAETGADVTQLNS